MPTAAHATASSATRPAISRPRSVRPASQWRKLRPGGVTDPAWLIPARPQSSAARLQHVADAAHGVNHRVPARVDLLAQVADVQLDHMGLAAEVVVPDPVQDLRLG